MEQQDAIRRSFRRLTELPQDRRPMVRREVVRLRQLTPEERASKMDNDDFRSRFSESERQIIQDLANSPAPGGNVSLREADHRIRRIQLTSRDPCIPTAPD